MIKKETTLIVIFSFLIVLLVVIIQNTVLSSIVLFFLFFLSTFMYIRIEQKNNQKRQDALKIAENKLQKIKQKEQEITTQFLELSTSFGSGLLFIDEDGIIKHSNNEVKDYFEKSYLNLHYNEIKEVPKLQSFIDTAYLTEKTMQKQILFNNKNYDIISTPIFDKKYFKGVIILIHDITDIKTAEKYQKRFTADVSHELKTPLSAIKGFSEILSRGDAISEKNRKEFIEHIQTEALRMEVILNDLLIISKMDRLDYELHISSVSTKTLLDEAIGVLANEYNVKGIKLLTQIEDTTIEVDRFKVVQVLLNMLKNALNYTDKGSVHVTAKTHDDMYHIEIKDTGIGIPEDKLDKIFKRFYRIDKDRSRITGGSGLGLSISKNVVKKHGGIITVTSKIDKGSTFLIKLPLVQPKTP